ncbi:hypothetical protein [Streptosporangium sp. NPDC004631]
MTTTLIGSPEEEPTTSQTRKARTLHRRTSGEGTLYQRTDGRWEGAAYVLSAKGQTTRVRVYGKTRREAADKLTKKIADHQHSTPRTTRDLLLADYLTNWLDHVAVHAVRASTLARYRACLWLYLIPYLAPASTPSPPIVTSTTTSARPSARTGRTPGSSSPPASAPRST